MGGCASATKTVQMAHKGKQAPLTGAALAEHERRLARILGTDGSPPASQEDSGPQIEFFVSARKLPKTAKVVKRNPVVVAWMLDPGAPKEVGGTDWDYLGRTEMRFNDENPDFFTSFSVNLNPRAGEPDDRRRVRIELYFSNLAVKLLGNSTALADDDLSLLSYVGGVECPVRELLDGQSGAGRLEAPLVQMKGSGPGKGERVGESHLVIRAEASSRRAQLLGRVREYVSLRPSAVGLEAVDLLRLSDPFLRVYRAHGHGPWDAARGGQAGAAAAIDWVLVHQTSVVPRDVNPVWVPAVVSADKLCGSDPARPLRFEVWDWDRVGKNTEIGSAHTTLGELLGAPLCKFPLVNAAKKTADPLYRGSGSLVLFETETFAEDSEVLVKYIRGGMRLNLAVGIDFSSSPKDPARSLHQGEVEAALKAVASVLAPYDSDNQAQMFAFGMAGKEGPDKGPLVPVQELSDRPIRGVEGILAAYRDAAKRLSPGGQGRTCMAGLLGAFHQMARLPYSQRNEAYNVFVVFTHGQVEDVPECVREIVEMSFLPASILVVGVGGGDFTSMNALDADRNTLEHGGMRAARDIVQFVRWRSYRDHPFRMREATVEELLHQLVTFMAAHGMTPNVASTSGSMKRAAAHLQYDLDFNAVLQEARAMGEAAVGRLARHYGKLRERADAEAARLSALDAATLSQLVGEYQKRRDDRRAELLQKLAVLLEAKEAEVDDIAERSASSIEAERRRIEEAVWPEWNHTVNEAVVAFLSGFPSHAQVAARLSQVQADRKAERARLKAAFAKYCTERAAADRKTMAESGMDAVHREKEAYAADLLGLVTEFRRKLVEARLPHHLASVESRKVIDAEVAQYRALYDAAVGRITHAAQQKAGLIRLAQSLFPDHADKVERLEKEIARLRPHEVAVQPELVKPQMDDDEGTVAAVPVAAAAAAAAAPATAAATGDNSAPADALPKRDVAAPSAQKDGDVAASGAAADARASVAGEAAPAAADGPAPASADAPVPAVDPVPEAAPAPEVQPSSEQAAPVAPAADAAVAVSANGTADKNAHHADAEEEDDDEDDGPPVLVSASGPPASSGSGSMAPPAAQADKPDDQQGGAQGPNHRDDAAEGDAAAADFSTGWISLGGSGGGGGAGEPDGSGEAGAADDDEFKEEEDAELGLLAAQLRHAQESFGLLERAAKHPLEEMASESKEDSKKLVADDLAREIRSASLPEPPQIGPKELPLVLDGGLAAAEADLAANLYVRFNEATLHFRDSGDWQPRAVDVVGDSASVVFLERAEQYEGRIALPSLVLGVGPDGEDVPQPYERLIVSYQLAEARVDGVRADAAAAAKVLVGRFDEQTSALQGAAASAAAALEADRAVAAEKANADHGARVTEAQGRLAAALAALATAKQAAVEQLSGEFLRECEGAASFADEDAGRKISELAAQLAESASRLPETRAAVQAFRNEATQKLERESQARDRNLAAEVVRLEDAYKVRMASSQRDEQAQLVRQYEADLARLAEEALGPVHEAAEELARRVAAARAAQLGAAAAARASHEARVAALAELAAQRALVWRDSQRRQLGMASAASGNGAEAEDPQTPSLVEMVGRMDDAARGSAGAQPAAAVREAAAVNCAIDLDAGYRSSSDALDQKLTKPFDDIPIAALRSWKAPVPAAPVTDPAVAAVLVFETAPFASRLKTLFKPPAARVPRSLDDPALDAARKNLEMKEQAVKNAEAAAAAAAPSNSAAGAARPAGSGGGASSSAPAARAPTSSAPAASPPAASPVKPSASAEYEF